MTLDLKDTIRTIPDYPKQGITFRDITTLLGDARVEAPHGHEEVAVTQVRVDVVRVQRQRALKFLLALGEVPVHREWAHACAEAWNAVEDELGSFADEHSTL